MRAALTEAVTGAKFVTVGGPAKREESVFEARGKSTPKPPKKPSTPVPAPAKANSNFQKLSGKALKSAQVFVDDIPDDKLLGAGDALGQGTIISQGGAVGFRLDRQKPPGASSGFQAQLQVQINGPSKKGVPSSVGGVRVRTGSAPTPAEVGL